MSDPCSPQAAFAKAHSGRRGAAIFFLDLDDVLITHRAAYGVGPGRGLFNTIDPVAMGLFNRLARLAKARVVLCSAKRFDRGIRQHLIRNGLAVPFHRDWRTRALGQRRGHEVQDWLDRHPRHAAYLIFDDGADFLPHQRPFHIQPQAYEGMSWQNYQQARDLLGFKPGD